MPEADRYYGQVYTLNIVENVNVLGQYKAGIRPFPLGENRNEFPHRSIIRGDFDSKHCGTVTWEALQKFKTHLLASVLSMNGYKLSFNSWQSRLFNYIESCIEELENEMNRSGSNFRRQFFTEILGENQEFDLYMPEYQRIAQSSGGGSQGGQGIQGTQGTQEVQGIQGVQGDQYVWMGPWNNMAIYSKNDVVSFNGISYASLFDYNEGNIPLSGIYWGPYIQGIQGTQGTQGTQETQSIQGTQGTQSTQGLQSHQIAQLKGMISNMIQHLNQMKDLKYDYSNLDEVMTKNWLYLKVSKPNIEPLGTDEVISSFPYYNEVYIDHKLADVYLLFVLDEDPPEPENGGPYSKPDFLVRDKWLTRAPGAGSSQVDGTQMVDKIRPKSFEYQFLDKILIYQKSQRPDIHSEDNPRIIQGIEYEFQSSPGGQPNFETITKFKMTPMRLQLKCMYPIRGEKIFIMDSTAYDIESEIERARSLLLPNVFSKVLTYYDNNFATNNALIVDYFVNVTKEFPWMRDIT